MLATILRKRILILSSVLSLALLAAACNKPDNDIEIPQPQPSLTDDVEETPQAEPSLPVNVWPLPNVDSLVRTAEVVKEVTSSKNKTLAPGVTWTKFSMTIAPSTLDATPKDHHENLYILAVDPYAEGISIRVATPQNSQEIPTGEWPRATLTSMAKSLQSDTVTVLAMTNCSFWNVNTITPRGPIHCDGTVMFSTFDPLRSGKQGVSYFGVTKEGSVSIAASSEYEAKKGLYTNLTGSGIILVQDGNDLDNSAGPDKDREPRTAIGYTSKGVVFLLCVDGRNSGGSDGMTMDDMGSIFAALGCEAAVNVDGGGSSQMLIRDPDTGTRAICNHPSDGAERAVIDGWAIIKISSSDRNRSPRQPCGRRPSQESR